MNYLKIAIAILTMMLLATGCFGPAKVTTPDETPTGISQLNIVINRPGSVSPMSGGMSLMSVAPQNHDTREHFLRVVAWHKGGFDVTPVKVMQDIPVEEHQNGQVTVELKLPRRLGYRVIALEWVDRSIPNYGTHDEGEPVFIGVTEPVDVLTAEPTIVTIDMNSVLTSPPMVFVQNPTETGGERIRGSITIPHDFKFGEMLVRFESSDSPESEELCRSMVSSVASSHIDTVPPVRVDWQITTPILQQDDPITCTFVTAVEILDVRPQSSTGPQEYMYFWSDPITVTVTPPDGGIGF